MKKILLAFAALILTFTAFSNTVSAQSKKPNILIIWGDDVGMWNISAYHRGMMGGKTPNIDRIAKEGILFMDHYAQASCTAGRAAFITGQYPIRVGLATVGLPGSEQGMSTKDPTLATLLKPYGYTTGQFGKNHLGDRDEHLPTNNGFDEFFGILYHLNAGEYPEQYDFPKGKAAKYFSQRGIMHAWAQPDGTQKIEDKGSFGQERQRNLEWEILAESKRFIREAVNQDKPFFVWHNTTRMHYRTNLSPKYQGKSGYGIYADGMMELDDIVGELLELLDELGIADNTMVMFSTDNGAASNSWPDGGNQPFRGEKGVGGFEGGFKVPMMVKWPGVVPPDTTIGGFMTMEDWLPTIMAQLGEPDLKNKLLKSYNAGKRSYEKIHLDGYDQTALITGKGPSNRKEFYYFTETTLHGVRYGDWKFLFKKQDRWFNGVQQDMVTPLVTNLKLDPFERFHEARGFDEWQENHAWTYAPAFAQVGKFVQSLKEYPPRSTSLDFDIDEAMRVLTPKEY